MSGGLIGIIIQLIAGAAEAATAGGLDVGSIIQQVLAGGVGGGLLMAIIGVVKQAMGGASTR